MGNGMTQLTMTGSEINTSQKLICSRKNCVYKKKNGRCGLDVIEVDKDKNCVSFIKR
ncbi:MAG: DUF1540 domain-containing protein [Gammaproteobacteria bacterium]|uniref:DUF1540 domain-containing protein n=1 Tax=viral metagenome TaxID=1070528 RepID=A0A6M3IXW8_9ZZZZ|nr:DUF1540 domain-containing protein [Gammaproteobacteria bacterium]